MLALWIVVSVLCILVVFETVLLMLLLRALGQLRQQGAISSSGAIQSGGLDIGEKAPSFIATNDLPGLSAVRMTAS